MAILGAEKQEEKIVEMGKTGREMFPEISLMNFKGAFRMGVKSALEKSGYQEWKELVDKTKTEKKKFFDLILDGSRHHLENLGLHGSDIDKLNETLKKKNEAFVNRA